MMLVRAGAVCVLAVVVQLAVFVDVRFFGVAPELLALVAVLAGAFGGPERGPIVAFGAGLLWDIYLPSPLGVAAIVYALVAFAIASLDAGLFHDSRVQLVVLAGVGTGATVIGYALLGTVVGETGLVGTRLLVVAGVAGLLNAVLAPLAAPLVRWAVAEPERRVAAAPRRVAP